MPLVAAIPAAIGALGATGAATLGAAAVGAGSSIYAASKGASAVRDATNAQTAANGQAQAFQERQYNDLAPWRDAGAAALQTLTAANKGDYSAFAASPDYNFRVAEGARAVTGNAAARGLMDSGALGKGLIQFGQQAGSQEYGSWYSRIANLAGVGQQAANAGQPNANAAGQFAQDQGENLSSGYLTQGAIGAGLMQGIGSTAAGLIRSNPVSRPGVVNNAVGYQPPAYIGQQAMQAPSGFSTYVPSPGLFGSTV